MIYGWNIKNKNSRWPFPTVHVFEEASERSSCGLVSKEKMTNFSNGPPAFTTICEKCCYNKSNLRTKFYQTT